MTAARLVIDRIEGEQAVLVHDDGTTAEVPATWLPSGAQEGDAVVLQPTGTDDRRTDGEARLARLRADAVDGDLDL